MQMPRPSYLVNRWLTSVVRLYASEIADLIKARDRAIAARMQDDAAAARADRTLEVTSELRADLEETARRFSVDP